MDDLHIDIWQGVLPQNDIPAIQKKLDGRMTLKSGGSTLLSERVDELAKAFKQPLDW